MINRLIIFSILCSQFSVANATNGYFPTGFGPQSKGLAGAGVAFNKTALGGVSNPALLVHVGHQLEVAVDTLNPPRGFNAKPHTPLGPYPIVTPDNYESENNFFLSPGFAYNYPVAENATLGFSLTGAGMSSEYNSTIFDYFYPGADPFFIATAPAGVEIMQFNFGLPFSLKLNDTHSIGITPIFNLQSFEAKGGEPFRQVSLYPNHVTNNGRSWSTGFGVRVGWQGVISDSFTLGASYQPRSDMSKFDEYQGLFAEAGDFDIPATAQIGLAFKFYPDLTFVVDYQYIGYGDIKSLANPNNTPLVPGSNASNYMGKTTGTGGGWEDADIIKLGLEWQYSDALTYRVGYSKSNKIIPNSQLLINIVAPVVNDEHFSLGATYRMDDAAQWSIALTHAPKVTDIGYNPNTGGVTGQQGEIYMEQTELSLSYTHSF